MQQVTRKTLGAGINLTCVTTPKFKRAVLRAMLVLPLGGEDAALRACLPQVLRRGTARLNDMQAFGTALDELYGARIAAAVRKEGENLCIGFLSDCIDEAYAPGADGLTAGVIGLLCDLLYNPYLQDEVARVGRDPIRKLDASDRLINPLLTAYNFGMKVDQLIFGAAAALRYDNAEDPQSVELQKTIAEQGAAAALEQYSGLTADHPLSTRILDVYRALAV